VRRPTRPHGIRLRPRFGPHPGPSQTSAFLRRGPRHGRERRSRDILSGMQPLRAHVHNGRLQLDEPTDLPDGAEIDLVAIEDDGLSPEERAELHASLDRALEDRQAGRTVDAWAYLKQYRAHRESPSTR